MLAAVLHDRRHDRGLEADERAIRRRVFVRRRVLAAARAAPGDETRLVGIEAKPVAAPHDEVARRLAVAVERAAAMVHVVCDTRGLELAFVGPDDARARVARSELTREARERGDRGGAEGEHVALGGVPVVMQSGPATTRSRSACGTVAAPLAPVRDHLRRIVRMPRNDRDAEHRVARVIVVRADGIRERRRQVDCRMMKFPAAFVFACNVSPAVSSNVTAAPPNGVTKSSWIDGAREREALWHTRQGWPGRCSSPRGTLGASGPSASRSALFTGSAGQARATTTKTSDALS